MRTYRVYAQLNTTLMITTSSFIRISLLARHKRLISVNLRRHVQYGNHLMSAPAAHA